MPAESSTNLEHQIRSQPDALTALLGSADVRRQVHEAAERLHRSRRLWVVGTGTSLHAAELGASLIQLSGRQAHAVPAMQFVDFAPLVGPQDGVIVITHTAETAFALSTRAQAFTAGLGPVLITKRGSGFPDAIETVEKETSDTYTVSYTTAVLALAMLAKELGAEQLDDATLGRVPAAVAAAIADPSVGAIPQPERLLVLVGAGPSAVTAREGALKVREASRFLAEGYDAEYLLHGSAVPLDARDRLVALFPPGSERPGRGGRARRRTGARPGHAPGRAGRSSRHARAAPAHGPAAAPGAAVRGGAFAEPRHRHRGSVERPGDLGDRRAVTPVHREPATTERTP